MTEFERFFEDVFKPALESVDFGDGGKALTSGNPIAKASWDRRAAYLLFVLRQPPTPVSRAQELFG